MKKRIASFVHFGNLMIRVDKFIEKYVEENPYLRSMKTLPNKIDTRYFNTGPTAYALKKTVAVFQRSPRTEEECIGVYEFWHRNDGQGFDVFIYESLEDYHAYTPSNEMPDSIKKEIGLCQNYHTGI